MYIDMKPNQYEPDDILDYHIKVIVLRLVIKLRKLRAFVFIIIHIQNFILYPIQSKLTFQFITS